MIYYIKDISEKGSYIILYFKIARINMYWRKWKKIQL